MRWGKFRASRKPRGRPEGEKILVFFGLSCLPRLGVQFLAHYGTVTLPFIVVVSRGIA
jgi:hypothetical protein